MHLGPAALDLAELLAGPLRQIRVLSADRLQRAEVEDTVRLETAHEGGVIGEIHLAGHSEDPLLGRSLLIDSHDAPISEEVWQLYDWLLARCGADRPPTLIERDDEIPEFDVLLAERERATAMMAGTWNGAIHA